MTYTIGQLGSTAGISRSTLLYYNRIKLLSPSGRSPSGYRLYSDTDKSRLETIMLLREIGLSLNTIRQFLDHTATQPSGLFLKRLFAINGEIANLREQQRLILDLMETDGSLRGVNKILHQFRSLGKEAGITAANSRLLHQRFEENSPELHRRLLTYLGFSKAEIRQFIHGLR